MNNLDVRRLPPVLIPPEKKPEIKPGPYIDPRRMPPVFVPPDVKPDDNEVDTNSFLSSNSLLILFGLLLYFAVKK